MRCIVKLLNWFIFFPGKENEPKETAVSRLTLRVDVPNGPRGNSLRSNSPRALSLRHIDARRGTKGKNQKPKKIE
jgi:hypothetical protein